MTLQAFLRMKDADALKLSSLGFSLCSKRKIDSKPLRMKWCLTLFNFHLWTFRLLQNERWLCGTHNITSTHYWTMSAKPGQSDGFMFQSFSARQNLHIARLTFWLRRGANLSCKPSGLGCESPARNVEWEMYAHMPGHSISCGPNIYKEEGTFGCSFVSAPCNLQAPPCNSQAASCSLQAAPCNLQAALCGF